MGFVFVALIAAIVASMGSTLSSIATIFTSDVVKVVTRKPSKRLLVIVGRFAAIVALIVAMVRHAALGHFDQAFQYIQEYNGFFTPGIAVIFLLGLFWKRTTETGALLAAVGSVAVSTFYAGASCRDPVHRAGWATPSSSASCWRCRIAVVEAQGAKLDDRRQRHRLFDGPVYDIATIAIVAILVLLYAVWW